MKPLRLVANKFPSGVAGAGNDYFAWLDQVGTLAFIDVSDHDTTTESYADIDPSAVWHVYVVPVEVVASSGATNPERAFDGRHDTYGSIACTGATAYAHYRLPSWPQLGEIADVYTAVLYNTTSTGAGATSSTVNARFGIYNVTAGTWHFNDATDTTNPMKLTKDNLNTPSVKYTAGAAWVKGSGKWNATREPWTRWAWQGEDAAGDAQECVFRIEVTQNGANVDPIAIAMLIDFKPYANSNFSRRLK